jgi:hypothetical protein
MSENEKVKMTYIERLADRESTIIYSGAFIICLYTLIFGLMTDYCCLLLMVLVETIVYFLISVVHIIGYIYVNYNLNIVKRVDEDDK